MKKRSLLEIPNLNIQHPEKLQNPKLQSRNFWGLLGSSVAFPFTSALSQIMTKEREYISKAPNLPGFGEGRLLGPLTVRGLGIREEAEARR
jgi:hypothetical protein